MVERSIAWMTRGARRVPYRGVVKNNAWWVNRAAAINLKRLLNLGLTNQNGALSKPKRFRPAGPRPGSRTRNGTAQNGGWRWR